MKCGEVPHGSAPCGAAEYGAVWVGTGSAWQGYLGNGTARWGGSGQVGVRQGYQGFGSAGWGAVRVGQVRSGMAAVRYGAVTHGRGWQAWVRNGTAWFGLEWPANRQYFEQPKTGINFNTSNAARTRRAPGATS